MESLAAKESSFESTAHPVWAKRPTYTRLTPTQQQALFAGSGFTAVQVFEEGTKGWICITGIKLL
jgi:hypothetical protein